MPVRVSTWMYFGGLPVSGKAFTARSPPGGEWSILGGHGYDFLVGGVSRAQYFSIRANSTDTSHGCATSVGSPLQRLSNGAGRQADSCVGASNRIGNSVPCRPQISTTILQPRQRVDGLVSRWPMWRRPYEVFCVTRRRKECARIACRRRFADQGSTNRSLCRMPPIGPMFSACWLMSILTSPGTSGTARSCCCSRFMGCAVEKLQHCGSTRLTGRGVFFGYFV